MEIISTLTGELIREGIMKENLKEKMRHSCYSLYVTLVQILCVKGAAEG